MKHYFSAACSIELEDMVVVTGGQQLNGATMSTAQVYTTSGKGEKLPDFNTPRMLHACGHYLKDDKVVTISSLAD